jgi:hypothetical protein
MRNISDQCGRENQNSHFILKKFSEDLAVYEIVWKQIVEPERSQMTT